MHFAEAPSQTRTTGYEDTSEAAELGTVGPSGKHQHSKGCSHFVMLESVLLQKLATVLQTALLMAMTWVETPRCWLPTQQRSGTVPWTRSWT